MDSNLRYLSDAALISLARLRAGSVDANTDADGRRHSRRVARGLSTATYSPRGVQGLTQALRKEYAGYGITSKADIYGLANQGYSERRYSASDLMGFHRMADLLYGSDAHAQAQTLLTARAKVSGTPAPGAPGNSTLGETIDDFKRRQNEAAAAAAAGAGSSTAGLAGGITSAVTTGAAVYGASQLLGGGATAGAAGAATEFFLPAGAAAAEGGAAAGAAAAGGSAVASGGAAAASGGVAAGGAAAAGAADVAGMSAMGIAGVAGLFAIPFGLAALGGMFDGNEPNLDGKPGYRWTNDPDDNPASRPYTSNKSIKQLLGEQEGNKLVRLGNGDLAVVDKDGSYYTGGAHPSATGKLGDGTAVSDVGKDKKPDWWKQNQMFREDL